MGVCVVDVELYFINLFVFKRIRRFRFLER